MPTPVAQKETPMLHRDDESRRQAGCFEYVHDLGDRYVNDHCLVRGEDGAVSYTHLRAHET